MTSTITPQDRRQMQIASDACWWSFPVCWSGIRNDIEKRAQECERYGDIEAARDLARLARLANARVG